MADDQLSEVFDLIEARAQLTGAFAATGPWFARSEHPGPLKIIAVVRGGLRLSTNGISTPLHLRAGDVAILSNRDHMLLEGGHGDGEPVEIWPDQRTVATLFDAAPDADIVVGAHAEVNDAGCTLLLAALPAVAHLQNAADSITQVIDRLVDEALSGRVGSDFAMRQYGQLLLLEVLRAYLDEVAQPPGWLRLLSDSRLRPAVRLIHQHPDRPWTLADLARAAAMSRSTFAERFRYAAGVPPLTYLGTWRMQLARRALAHRHDVLVGALASELGYGSESAFSTAFKREVGVSPLAFRRQARSA